MHPKAAPSLQFPGPIALAAILSAVPASAQFVDRTAEAGLAWFQTSWGAVLADLDGDGSLDVYTGHHLFPPRLFWNEQDGTFNANLHPQPWSGPTDRHGAIAVPLGASGAPDILVTHGGAGGAGTEPNELYRNDGGGALVAVVGAWGLDDPSSRTRCASAADFDGDLRVDLWVGKAPAVGSASSLFRNEGGTFTDVAAAVGLAEVEGTVGGIWGDFDDDGDPDLLTGGEEFSRPTRLWRNDGGAFVDASSLFLPPLPVVSGADWGDLDGDGDLDLAVCDGMIGIFDTYAEGDTVSFFFNTRYGDTGVDGLTVPATADTVRAVFRYRAFLDNSLVFLGPSRVNPPPGVIVLTDEHVGAPAFDPGVELGIFVWRTAPGGRWEVRCSTPDVNFDTFDGWLTQGTSITNVAPYLLDDSGFVPGAPRVWRNDGTQFTEVSAALGLPPAMVNPRDISCVDYDNDGDLDLHVVDMGTSELPNAPDVLLRNDGGGFADVSGAEGIAGGTGGLGDGAVWGDVDRDGDLDVYVAQGAGPLTFSANGPALFLENDGDRGNSIQVDLVGRAPNAAAVGARVVAVTAAGRVERRVRANSWRSFQDPLRVHLGLGGATAADSLVLRWPSGREEIFLSVPAGIYRLEEGVAVVGLPPSGTPGPGEGLDWRVTSPRPQPARGLQTFEILSRRPVRIRVSVYDIAGRRVRVIHQRLVPSGVARLVWDGRDQEGRRVAAGVYLLRIEGKGGTPRDPSQRPPSLNESSPGRCGNASVLRATFRTAGEGKERGHGSRSNQPPGGER